LSTIAQVYMWLELGCVLCWPALLCWFDQAWCGSGRSPGWLPTTVMLLWFLQAEVAAAFKWLRALGWLNAGAARRGFQLSSGWLKRLRGESVLADLLSRTPAATAALQQLGLPGGSTAASKPDMAALLEQQMEQQRQQQLQQEQAGGATGPSAAATHAPAGQPDEAGRTTTTDLPDPQAALTKYASVLLPSAGHPGHFWIGSGPPSPRAMPSAAAAAAGGGESAAEPRNDHQHDNHQQLQDSFTDVLTVPGALLYEVIAAAAAGQLNIGLQLLSSQPAGSVRGGDQGTASRRGMEAARLLRRPPRLLVQVSSAVSPHDSTVTHDSRPSAAEGAGPDPVAPASAGSGRPAVLLVPTATGGSSSSLLVYCSTWQGRAGTSAASTAVGGSDGSDGGGDEGGLGQEVSLKQQQHIPHQRSSGGRLQQPRQHAYTTNKAKITIMSVIQV